MGYHSDTEKNQLTLREYQPYYNRDFGFGHDKEIGGKLTEIFPPKND